MQLTGHRLEMRQAKDWGGGGGLAREPKPWAGGINYITATSRSFVSPA